MRILISTLSGALFGLGLLISGMTDTVRVQGYLDFFGPWDPTLMFVMAGGMAPMIIAWRIAAARRTAFTGSRLPAAPGSEITPRLIIGSLMFGAGWGLAGFCPGPAIVSLGFLDSSAVVFTAAMAVAMIAARPVIGLIENPRQVFFRRVSA